MSARHRLMLAYALVGVPLVFALYALYSPGFPLIVQHEALFGLSAFGVALISGSACIVRIAPGGPLYRWSMVALYGMTMGLSLLAVGFIVGCAQGNCI